MLIQLVTRCKIVRVMDIEMRMSDQTAVPSAQIICKANRFRYPAVYLGVG